MKNLADSIEDFIVKALLAERENALMVQRNELAEQLECAPSQISYVLSTRFTPEKGFMVESRRGSGGFVRIVRVQPALPAQPVQQHVRELPAHVEQAHHEVVQRHELTAEEAVDHLTQQRLLTKRENALLHFMLHIMDTNDKRKKAVLKQALAALDSADRG